MVAPAAQILHKTAADAASEEHVAHDEAGILEQAGQPRDFRVGESAETAELVVADPAAAAHQPESLQQALDVAGARSAGEAAAYLLASSTAVKLDGTS